MFSLRKTLYLLIAPLLLGTPSLPAATPPSASAALAPTTLTLSVPASAPAGAPVTLTATISAAPGGPSFNGQSVSLMVNGSPLFSLSFSSGTATITSTALPIGADGVQAIFYGDAYYAPSSSAVQTINVIPASGTNNALLQGRYAFLVSGSEETTGLVGPMASHTVAAAGSFAADGHGKITSGVADFNSGLGASLVVPVTGNYQIDGDSRGYINLDLQGGAVLSFVISVQALSPGGAVITQSGVLAVGSTLVGQGTLALQDLVDSGPPPTPIGFTLSGETACFGCFALHGLGPVAAAGVVSVNGDQLSGTATFNLGSYLAYDRPLSGAYSKPSPAGRATLTLTYPDQYSDLPSNYVEYIVNSHLAYLLSTDSHASYILLSGIAATP